MEKLKSPVTTAEVVVVVGSPCPPLFMNPAPNESYETPKPLRAHMNVGGLGKARANVIVYFQA